MIKISEQYDKYLKYYHRFGLYKTLITIADKLINYVIYIDCLHIIVLKRNCVKTPRNIKENRIKSKFANKEDLLNMMKMKEWDIDEFKIKQFNEGDVCLLAFIDCELAGYTWAHLKSRPVLIPGIRIKIPDHYIYNYAGFTHPKFRGKNLQSYRHYQLLNNNDWKDKRGLLGYVKYSNWSSIRGQTKSGYVSIGRLWVIGKNNKYFVLISKSLKEIGINRIE